MEAVIFIGIPAGGKSTFYVNRLYDTHVRVNLDMLRTRHREARLIETCLQTRQPFVVDNTNVSAEQRSWYINAGRAAGFRVIGYYFRSEIEACLRRNQERSRRIPDRALLGMHKSLQIPAIDEGFDELHYVTVDVHGEYRVEPWRHEV